MQNGAKAVFDLKWNFFIPRRRTPEHERAEYYSMQELSSLAD
jgi:hypothetical protein